MRGLQLPAQGAKTGAYLNGQEALADGATGMEGLLVALHVVGFVVIADRKGAVGDGLGAEGALEAGGVPLLAQGHDVLGGREQTPQAQALPAARTAVLVSCNNCSASS